MAPLIDWLLPPTVPAVVAQWAGLGLVVANLVANWRFRKAAAPLEYPPVGDLTKLFRFCRRWFVAWMVILALAADVEAGGIAVVLAGVLVLNQARHRRRLAELRARSRHWGPPGPWGWPPPTWGPPSWPPPPSGGDRSVPPPAAPTECSSRGGAGHLGTVGRGLIVALVVGAVAVGVVQVGSPPAEAATARPAGGASSAPSLGLPNPFAYLFEGWLDHVFQAKARQSLQQVIAASEASLLTPPVADNARVAQIRQVLVEVGDSILLLLIIVGAVMVIAGDWTYLEAKALAPRVVLSGVALNLSLVVAEQAVKLSNAAVTGFLSVGNLSTTGSGLAPLQQVSAPVLLALLLIAGLGLLLGNLIRLVVVLVVTVGGPLCNVFGVLPATEGIAVGWWRALAACLIAPAVQALLLVIGVWIALAPSSPFQAAFGGQAWTGLVDAVMVLAIVVLMAISPLWMLKKALGGGYHQLAAAARWGRRAVMA